MHLVGVLHDQVFPFLQLHTRVNNTAEQTPPIVHVQVDLVSKLVRFELLSAQDDVFGRISQV